MKEIDQKRLKGVSKAAAILAVIGKVCLIIAIPFLVLVMVAIPLVFKDVKITKDEIAYKSVAAIKVDESRTKIDVYYKNDLIHTEENAGTIVKLLDKIDDNTSSKIVKYVDSSLGVAIVSIIIMIVVLSKVRKLLKNINTGDTPFTEENVELLKKIATLLIVDIVVPMVMTIILNLVFDIDLNNTFAYANIFEILFIICLVFIFRYGVLLQKNSKEKIYD